MQMVSTQGAAGAVWQVFRYRSGLFGLELFFDLLDFFSECLVEQAGPFAPGFASGLGFGSVGGHFTTVNILESLFLSLKFCAQFVFCHCLT